MNFPSNNCHSLAVFLIVTFGSVESWSTDTAADSQQDQPFWRHVLREFLFRTISTSLSDEILYERLQVAPFYGGPLPEVTNDEDSVLSRGSVYRMPDDQWILCQDDCNKCESCAQQNNPTVKWTLRRVKHWTSQGPPKWDLQLTVLPQLVKVYPSSLTRAQLHNKADTSHKEPKPEGSEKKVSTTTDRGLAVDEPREKTSNIERRRRLPEMDQNNLTVKSSRGKVDSAEDSTVRTREHREDLSDTPRKNKFRDLTRIKRYRSRVRPIGRPGPLAFYYPQEDYSRIDGRTDKLRDGAGPRLIMGIDQYGDKHLIHVIPVDSPVQDPVGHAEYPTSQRSSYQTGNMPRISRTIQRSTEEAVYEKLMDRILESLKIHRNIIETFLFSERLEPDFEKVSPRESFVSPYSSYSGEFNDNERFPGGDDADYRNPSLQRADRYPVHSEYQVVEQDDEYRHYADVGEEVNRPGAVYQDQSSMIEYKTHGMSANDQQRQDERSLPRADAERTRRNSLPKLIDSSANLGHRPGSSVNHKEINATDDASTIKMKDETASDEAPGYTRLTINQSDSRMQNFSMESTTVKLQTGESG